MLVKATKFFISAVYGNVDAGKVLEMNDARGRILINAGLVAAYSSPVDGGGNPSSFRSPVEANLPGLSSPAGQVSQKTTVSASESGEKKVTYRKSGKSRS